MCCQIKTFKADHFNSFKCHPFLSKHFVSYLIFLITNPNILNVFLNNKFGRQKIVLNLVLNLYSFLSTRKDLILTHSLTLYLISLIKVLNNFLFLQNLKNIHPKTSLSLFAYSNPWFFSPVMLFLWCDYNVTKLLFINN